MRKYYLLIFISLLFPVCAFTQQFAGFSGTYFGGVVQLPSNPSFVVKEKKGIEINLASASAMAGTNGYAFTKEWFTDGLPAGAREGEDYFKSFGRKKKHLWGNVDVRGPAVSFTVKDIHHFGVYTRMRQVTRGGNIDNHAFQVIGNLHDSLKFPDTFQFDKAGFSSHTFGEIGLTYGRYLNYDLNHVWKGGITIKYLAGFAAGSLYTPSTQFIKNSADSTWLLTGALTALYSDNFGTHVDNDPQNEFESWMSRGGKGSIGFDIGVQYEYHPIADINKTTPYSFRFSASITDIGSIAYEADTGSGAYQVNIRKKAYWQYERHPFEDYESYLTRLKKDTALISKADSASSFRVGLPTALRLNSDWNMGSNFWLGVNVVLNMRGNSGDIYKPAYVNMLNLSPRYEKGWFMIGLPFSYWGYETMTFGAMLRVGPLFVGSTSIISTVIAKKIRNADGYAGLAFRIPERKKDFLP